MTWPALVTDDPVPWLLLGGAALGAWVVAFLVATMVTRPGRHGVGCAPVETPGPETPAVAHLLTHRCRVRPSAASATLVDLAARGAFGIESIGNRRMLLRLRGHGADTIALTAAERLVLSHVEERAVHREVPAAVLAEGAPAHWLEDFRRCVEEEAEELGLVGPRWSRTVRLGLVTAGAVAMLPFAVAAAAGAAAAGPATAGAGHGGSLPLIGCTWAALVLVAERCMRHRFRGLRPTPAGAEVARRWTGHRRWLQMQSSFHDVHADAVTIWDRRLAYACAVGCAPAVATTFPLAPEPDEEAWSPAGGRWHEVTVVYPRSPGHGLSRRTALVASVPRTLLAGSAAATVGAVAAPWWLHVVVHVRSTPAPSPVVDTFETVAAATAGVTLLAVLVWCTVVLVRWSPVLVRALRDGGPSEVVDGVVVKLADRPTGRQRDDGTPIVVRTTAVDDGHGLVVPALYVRPGSVQLYDRVRVEVSRHLRHVRSVTRLPHQRPVDRQVS